MPQSGNPENWWCGVSLRFNTKTILAAIDKRKEGAFTVSFVGVFPPAKVPYPTHSESACKMKIEIIFGHFLQYLIHFCVCEKGVCCQMQ